MTDAIRDVGVNMSEKNHVQDGSYHLAYRAT